MDELILKKVNLTPTMRCNLKCKLCGVRVPHYEYCPQMSVKDMKVTIDAVFEIVDYVEKLQITGGEPFMHPQLAEIISYCFTYQKQFGSLWIITNGTIPAKSEFLEVVRHYSGKIVFHVSDYGVRKGAAEDFVKSVEATGCECRYLKYFGEEQSYGGWVDQGDFICHNRDEEDLKHVFKTCSQVVSGGFWYVRHGQMHWCGRSVRGTEVGKVPLREEDYLDVFKGTKEERREKLKKLMQRPYITACDYCNGDYGTCDSEKRFSAGEQM